MSSVPKATNVTLGNGEAGNLETVSIMSQVARQASADPTIRTAALAIVGHLGSNDYLNEALAIGQFVKDHVRYVKDPLGIEQLQDPRLLLANATKGEAQGDCDDMSALTAALLLSIGHQPYFKIVRYKSNSGSYNHIYTVVYEKNKADKVKTRLVLDCILKNYKIGSEVPYKSGREIAV